MVYLSGAIDFDRSCAVSWRDEWTDKLASIGINPRHILNPCKKPLPKDQFEFMDNEAEACDKYRKLKDWGGLCNVISEIAHIDLRLVDKSDVVLVNFTKVGQSHIHDLLEKHSNALARCADYLRKFGKEEAIQPILSDLAGTFWQLVTRISDFRVPTYGTIHEIVCARQQHKPVYIVWEGGKETCSGWIMWLVGHNNVFSTFDELLQTLKHISEGKAPYSAKDWLLFDF